MYEEHPLSAGPADTGSPLQHPLAVPGTLRGIHLAGIVNITIGRSGFDESSPSLTDHRPNSRRAGGVEITRPFSTQQTEKHQQTAPRVTAYGPTTQIFCGKQSDGKPQ